MNWYISFFMRIGHTLYIVNIFSTFMLRIKSINNVYVLLLIWCFYIAHLCAWKNAKSNHTYITIKKNVLKLQKFLKKMTIFSINTHEHLQGREGRWAGYGHWNLMKLCYALFRFHNRSSVHYIQYFFQDMKITDTNEEYFIILIHNTNTTIAKTVVSFHDRDAFTIDDVTFFLAIENKQSALSLNLKNKKCSRCFQCLLVAEINVINF